MNKFCIVVLLIAFSNPVISQFSVELNAGTKRAAAYLKCFHFIDKGNRWSIYSSNQVAVKYDACQPGFSSANILAYNFRAGIGLAAILIAGNSRLHPSAGLQYQKKLRSFYVYFLSTYELNRFTKQENYFTLLYSRKLSKKVNFIFYNENYICLLKLGCEKSLQRIKSGLEIRQTQFGLISETSQTGKTHQTHSLNLGCFIKQSF